MEIELKVSRRDVKQLLKELAGVESIFEIPHRNEPQDKQTSARAKRHQGQAAGLQS